MYPNISLNIKVPIGRIRTLHKGFQMLSESFALNKKEFEQIFTYDEAVFVMWDSDNNGKIGFMFEFE
jgi:hypothetical protein